MGTTKEKDKVDETEEVQAEAAAQEIDLTKNDNATEEARVDAQLSPDEVTEGLMVGNVAKATKGQYKGGFFAITRIVSHGSVADLVKKSSGNPEQLYNSPSEVEGSFIGGSYDSQTIVLSVEDNGLVKVSEDWRGTREGRRH